MTTGIPADPLLDGKVLYAPERQTRIMQEARLRGRVEVAEMARLLAITPETVRKDLNVLQRQGLLRRVHGGAVPVERLALEAPVTTRVAMSAEKDRIAAAAIAEVPDGGAILLESSSTVHRVVDHLPPDRELTVVTNYLPTALSLASRPNLTVIIIGGRVRSVSLASVDMLALEDLKRVFVDVAFVGTNGFSVEQGLTAPDVGEAAVKKAILERGQKRVLLTDHTKYGQTFLCRYGEVEDVDLIISDTGMDTETVDELRKSGPDVRLV